MMQDPSLTTGETLPATPVQPTQMDRGTIKSIDRQRGTGSIGPDQDAQVQVDIGFTSTVVGGDFNTLQVGDHVLFIAVPDPNRPRYGNATTVDIELDDDDEGIIDFEVTGLDKAIALTMSLDLARQINPGDLWDIPFPPKAS